MTTDTSDLVKKTDDKTKIDEIEKKILDYDHSKYIIVREFNKLTADNFATKLSTKDDIADFVKETDFDNKLNINKKVTSKKSKHVLVENELDELSGKIELISTKGLTKDSKDFAGVKMLLLLELLIVLLCMLIIKRKIY